MVQAWGAKLVHQSYRPSQPDRDDGVHFGAKWLMDDPVIVEPMVGLRPWLSAECLETVMQQTWGPEAINVQKMGEEGTFKDEQVVWGLIMNTKVNTTRLPPEKRLKAQYLLAQPELQHGSRKIPLRLGRELAGSAEHWITTQPSLRPEMFGLYGVLKLSEENNLQSVGFLIKVLSLDLRP